MGWREGAGEAVMRHRERMGLNRLADGETIRRGVSFSSRERMVGAIKRRLWFQAVLRGVAARSYT